MQQGARGVSAGSNLVVCFIIRLPPSVLYSLYGVLVQQQQSTSVTVCATIVTLIDAPIVVGRAANEKRRH